MISLALVLLSVGLAGGPHTNPASCHACHTRADAGVGPPRPDTETCQGCHAQADMHPVGVTPAETRVPDGWPLVDGTVSCRTCHDQPAHGLALEAPYLRGEAGADREAFCFSCHQADTYQRDDPHHPNDTQASCAACHTAPPPAGAAPAEARLRGAPAQACATCHPGLPHAFAAAHLGQPAGGGLPATAQGAIACFTCHDVHGGHDSGRPAPSPFGAALRAAAGAGSWNGVPPSATWPGTPSRGHPPLLALPLQGDALCAACHGEGPP